MPLFDHLRLEVGESFTFDKWDDLINSLENLALTVPDNSNGEIINQVAIGTKPGDGSEMNYPWVYETIGVNMKTHNLRLQSPNSVLVHTNIDGDEATNKTKISLAIHKNGKIGMGTIDPAQELHIYRLTKENVDLRLENKTGKPMDIFAGTDGCGLWSHGTKDMQFATNGKERLRINKDGHIGIGTNSPQEKLHVEGSIRGNISGGALQIQSTHGFIVVGAQNTTWAHLTTDRDKFYFNKEIHIHSGKVSSHKKSLHLCTEGVPQLTIQTNGSVGIGTTSPTEKLEVKGNIKGNAVKVNTLELPPTGKVHIGPWYIEQTGGGKEKSYLYIKRRTTGKTLQLLSIDWSGNVKARKSISGSDRRIKNNIYPFTDGLEKIKTMNPVNYTFNGLGNTIKGQKDVGFIAQEIEKIAPYLVTKTNEKLHPSDEQETELLNLNSMGFIPILVNAVKHLSLKIDTLEQQLNLEFSTKI